MKTPSPSGDKTEHCVLTLPSSDSSKEPQKLVCSMQRYNTTLKGCQPNLEPLGLMLGALTSTGRFISPEMLENIPFEPCIESELHINDTDSNHSPTPPTESVHSAIEPVPPMGAERATKHTYAQCSRNKHTPDSVRVPPMGAEQAITYPYAHCPRLEDGSFVPVPPLGAEQAITHPYARRTSSTQPTSHRVPPLGAEQTTQHSCAGWQNRTEVKGLSAMPRHGQFAPPTQSLCHPSHQPLSHTP